MKNIAILASGNGSNFEAIAKAVKQKRIKACLKVLICDVPGAFVIRRANRLKVKTVIIRKEDFLKREYFEKALIEKLREENIDLIVLAGFMRLFSAEFVKIFKNKMINIHPSLLPAFKGTQAIKDAFDYGVKVTGVTVHLVDEHMDHGPIIAQEEVKVSGKDSLSSLERKIHKVEHKIYPKVISAFILGKLIINKRKVKLT